MGYETKPDIALMDCPAGGCLSPTGWQNIPDHFFSMNAKAVAKYFVPLMRRNVEMLDEGWPFSLGIDGSADTRHGAVARWYLHQANGPLIGRTIGALNLPNELVPMHIERYGNISAASTLILLDEDRRAHLVSEGDLIAFLWVGGGCGTMNGFTLATL
jgi:3-oxoacyl-[acyl-carrier-protein] synthase-3